MSRLGLGAVSVGRFNFVCHERWRNALTAAFALQRESLLLLVHKKKPRKRHPSSAPASRVHSDAHVNGMRQKTHIAFAMLKHFAAPARCAGHPLPLRVYVASQWGPIQRGRPSPCVGLAACEAFENVHVDLQPSASAATFALPNCRAVPVLGCPSEPTRSTGPMDVRRTAPARPACLSIAKAM